MQILMVIVLLVSTVGCVQPKPYTLGKAFHTVPTAPTEYGQIIFYFPPVRGIDAMATSMIPVSEDNEVVTGLVKQTYTIYHATPGQHEYRIGYRFDRVLGINTAEVDVQAGKTYYIRNGVSSAFFAWFQFELVPEDIALEELEMLRHLKFHKDLYAAQ